MAETADYTPLSHLPSFSCSHLPQGLFVFIMSSPPERTNNHLTTISSSHFLFSLLLWPLGSNFVLILLYSLSLSVYDTTSIMKNMFSGYRSQLITSAVMKVLKHQSSDLCSGLGADATEEIIDSFDS